MPADCPLGSQWTLMDTWQSYLIRTIGDEFWGWAVRVLFSHRLENSAACGQQSHQSSFTGRTLQYIYIYIYIYIWITSQQRLCSCTRYRIASLDRHRQTLEKALGLQRLIGESAAWSCNSMATPLACNVCGRRESARAFVTLLYAAESVASRELWLWACLEYPKLTTCHARDCYHGCMFHATDTNTLTNVCEEMLITSIADWPKS